MPLMLGLDRVEPEYYSVIKQLLRMSESVGIIGGKPKSALYLVGFQDNDLVFLDPHHVQPACTSDEDLAANLNSYSCDSARLLPISKASSSISAGFFFNSGESFNSFQRYIGYMKASLKGVIAVADTTPDYLLEDSGPRDIVTFDDSDSEYLVF
jgi:cysteine protease ATG4